MYEKIGLSLRQARDDLGLSLEQVARKTGLPRQSIWYMEQGKAAAPLPKLAQVAEAVGLNLSVQLVPASESELQQVVEAWDHLDAQTRALIVSLADGSTHIPPEVMKGLRAMIGAWILSHKD